MVKLLSPKCLGAILLGLVVLTPAATAEQTTAPNLTLVVDESQAARRIAFVHEDIRVEPGPLELSYPLWIPGEHGPTGPIFQLAALENPCRQNPLALDARSRGNRHGSCQDFREHEFHCR